MGHRQPSKAGIWVPLLAGIFWLVGGASSGLMAFVFSIVPGCMLVTAGVAALRLPGDPRKFQLSALGGAAGVLLALPMIFAAGFFEALWLLLLSAASFVAAGWSSQRREPPWEDVPVAPRSLTLAAVVASDEAVLATLAVAHNGLLDQDLERVAEEVEAAVALFDARGWLEKPASFHVEPQAAAPRVRRGRAAGLEFEHLFFESGYAPHDEMPGRERWLAREANRTAHAWMLRHADARPRPWLLCIHGYGMGRPWVDLPAFQAERLHQHLGLNLLFPVLPLHGPRRAGLGRKEVFLGGDVMDAVHGEAQAIWDIRRLLRWVKTEGEATSVGFHGISLGGYTTALLASLEEELACVIAGIPVTDFLRLIFRLTPTFALREMERVQLERKSLDEVTSVISPLVLPPVVPRERRFIYAGTADRIVTPDQVRDLWRHWEEREIAWYAGTHFSFWHDPDVRRLVDRALREWLLG